MAVLASKEFETPAGFISASNKPIIEVDLDDCVLKDTNRRASAFAVRVTRGDYVFEQVLDQGRVRADEDPRLYALRQKYFDSRWHLARMQPEEDLADRFRAAAEMITIDILTGRREHLRPTLLNLFQRHDLREHIKGEIQLREPGEDYGSYKLRRAKMRRAQGAIDDDVQAIRDFSEVAKIFTVAVEQPWNMSVVEAPLVKKVKSFGAFVGELVTYPSWEAMVKDHQNKVELKRLVRTSRFLAWPSSI